MPSPKNGKRTRRANNGGAKKKGSPSSTKAAKILVIPKPKESPLLQQAIAQKKATKAGKAPMAASKPSTDGAQASRDKKKATKAGKAPMAASNPSTDNMGPPITLRSEAIGAAEQRGVSKPSDRAPSKAAPSKAAPGGAAPGGAAAPGGSGAALWQPPALSSMEKEMHNKIAKMMELSTVPTIVEGLTSNVSDDLTIWLDGTLSGKYNVNAKWPGYEKLPDTNRLFDQDGIPLCVGMDKYVYGSLQHIINRKTEKEKGEYAKKAAGDLQGLLTPEANVLDKMHQSNCGTDKQSWHLWTGREPDAAKKPHTTLDPKAEEGKAAVAMVNVIAHNSAHTGRNKLGFHKTTPASVFEDIQGELNNKCKYGRPERTFKGELLQWVNKTKDSEKKLNKQKRNARTILSKDGKYLPSYPGEADEFKSLMSSLMEIGENIRGNQKYEKHINSLFRILLLAFSCYASRLVACWGAYARAVVIAKEWGLPSPVQAAKTMISDCMDCTVTSMTAPQHSRAIEQAQRDYIVAAFAWNSAAPSNMQWVYPAVTPPATDPTTSVPLDREAIKKYVRALTQLLEVVNTPPEFAATSKSSSSVASTTRPKSPAAQPQSSESSNRVTQTNSVSGTGRGSSGTGISGTGSSGRGGTGRGSSGTGSGGRGGTGRGGTGRGGTGRGGTGRGSSGRGGTGGGKGTVRNKSTTHNRTIRN